MDVEPALGSPLVLGAAPVKRPEMSMSMSRDVKNKRSKLSCPRCKKDDFSNIRELGQHAMRCRPVQEEEEAEKAKPVVAGDRFGRMLQLKKLQKQHEKTVQSKAERERVEKEMSELVKMEKDLEEKELEMRRKKEAEEKRALEERKRLEREARRIEEERKAKEKKERELQQRAKLLLGDSDSSGSDSDSDDSAALERRRRLEEQMKKRNAAAQGHKTKSKSVDETSKRQQKSKQRQEGSGSVCYGVSTKQNDEDEDREVDQGEACPYEGYTWAHVAAFSNDATKLKSLEAAYMSTDPDGLTPLHICALYGSLDCLEVLMEYQLEQDEEEASTRKSKRLTRQVDSAGRTPLLCACYTGSFNVVAWLLQVDPEAMEIHDSQGNSPLMIAASYNSFDCVSFLLQFNGDANGPPNQTGSFAIHLTSSVEIVQALVEHGADYYAFDPSGRSALMLASGTGKLDIVKYLIELYQKPEYIGFPDFAGDTCLHAAAVVGSLETVRVLLEAGVDASVRNSVKLTAVDVAKVMDRKEVIEFFQEKQGAEAAEQVEPTEEVQAYVQGFHRSFVGEGTWVECIDEGSGYTYYYNTATMAATWERPQNFTSASELS